MVAVRSVLLANAAAVASAVWLNASKTPAKLSSFGSICEKAEAWTKLTVNPTVSGVQNIKFDEIQAMNEAQLEDYGSKIKTKQNEVESLEPRIAEALKNEAVPFVDATAMGQFISKALAPFGGQVKESLCGDPKTKVKTVRGAFLASQKTFPSVVSEFFSASLFDEEVFDEEFDKIAGEEGAYCARLKQRLKNAVVKGGMKPVIGGSAALIDQKTKLEKEISLLEEKTAQCKSDMSNIAAFEGTMKEQKKVYNVREDELMEAEIQLEDSLAELEKLDTELAEDEEKLAAVLEQLEKEGEKLAQAKTDLSDLRESDQEVKASLAEVTGQLKDVTEKLTWAKESDKVIEELRDAVSVTTLKMRLLFEEAALKPVMESGLSMQTNLNDVFFKSVGDIPGGDDVYKAAEALTVFCSDEALPAFAKVKNPDLSPLCPKTDAGEIMTIVTDSMVERMESVKKLLKQVQSWFDPYKGQHNSKVEFTKEKAESNVEMGEPEGLREIVGVFSSSTFYTSRKILLADHPPINPYTTQTQAMAEWETGFCVPSVPCCLTCWGCGCIPIYEIIQKIAPFDTLLLPIEAGSALLWALLFWLGSIYGVGQVSIVFEIALIIFAVGAKDRLNVKEDSLYTMVKTFFCAPCMMGQLAVTARHAAERAPLLAGQPVEVAP